MGKMEHFKIHKTIKTVLLILLISIVISLVLSFLRKIGFYQTIWMTIIIVLLCVFIVYSLLKIK